MASAKVTVSKVKGHGVDFCRSPIFIVLNKSGFRSSGKCHEEKIDIIVNGH